MNNKTKKPKRMKLKKTTSGEQNQKVIKRNRKNFGRKLKAEVRI